MNPTRAESDRIIAAAETVWPTGKVDAEGTERFAWFLVRHGIEPHVYRSYLDRQMLRSVTRFSFAVAAANLIARGVSWLFTYLGIFS